MMVESKAGFHDNGIPEEGFHCNFLPMIIIDPFFTNRKNYYLQVFLEE